MDKKQYSNSFHTLEAIWRVLQRYSSRQHPLTVREIHEYLRRLESEPPSLSTLDRSLREGMDLMELLFPGQVIPAAGGGQAVTAYQESGIIFGEDWDGTRGKERQERLRRIGEAGELCAFRAVIGHFTEQGPFPAAPVGYPDAAGRRPWGALYSAAGYLR